MLPVTQSSERNLAAGGNPPPGIGTTPLYYTPSGRFGVPLAAPHQPTATTMSQNTGFSGLGGGFGSTRANTGFGSGIGNTGLGTNSGAFGFGTNRPAQTTTSMPNIGGLGNIWGTSQPTQPSTQPATTPLPFGQAGGSGTG